MYTERRSKIIWATLENHCDQLLPECAKRREKETQIHHSQNFHENAFCLQTKTSVTT